MKRMLGLIVLVAMALSSTLSFAESAKPMKIQWSTDVGGDEHYEVVFSEKITLADLDRVVPLIRETVEWTGGKVVGDSRKIQKDGKSAVVVLHLEKALGNVNRIHVLNFRDQGGASITFDSHYLKETKFIETVSGGTLARALARIWFEVPDGKFNETLEATGVGTRDVAFHVSYKGGHFDYVK